MEEKEITIPEVAEKEEIAEVIENSVEEKTENTDTKKKKKSHMEKHEDLYFESEEQARHYEITRRVKLGFIYFFLVIAALFTLIPFYWMIITSFKNQEELQQIPATFIATTPFHVDSIQDVFANYITAFTTGRSSNGVPLLLKYIGNTLLVAALSTLLSTTTTVLAAFAFSRLEFKGRETLFSLLLATMMVPGEMMIMTNFTTIANWGLLDTYIALILPFGASVFYTFFLRQNFKQIPNELYYAAKVDGNSDFKYLFKVMIPIARPAIITVLILSMIGSWNAYIWPRTVSQGADMKLITDGLMSLFSSETGGDTSNIRMAATTVVSIPLLLAFACFKKYIMRGVARSGIKG